MAATTPAPRIRTPDSRTRRARPALFAVFGLNGMLSAVWIVHIPAVTARTGVTPTTLGMLILLMSGCAIAGMQTAGPLADRLGSRALTAAAATLLSLALLGPAFATSPLTLGLALCAFGFGNGAIDVSMNAQAVHIERAYPRPIMSAFHAFFSCGGFLGSAYGAATQHAHWPPHLTFVLASAFGLATLLLAVPHLLPHTAARAHSVPNPEVAAAAAREPADPALAQHFPAADAPDATRGSRMPGPGRTVLTLGLIAFALLMAEGVAADWSALQVKGRLGVDAGTAGLAFTGFSLTMTLGRFAADRVSGRFGRVAIVRWGTLVAATGFGLVAASGWLPLTLLGWTLCGIGLAGGVPQVFTAAGNLGSATSATDMSRVFGLGYVGLLAGPAIIGWLDKLVPLTAAMTVPLVAMLLCAWGARAVAAPARTGG
ncbi:MFS transporter [Nocardia yunnanensis]|uniref:MFS transporter n=1 Tax=Nocardia yunnanensis TaxID=2382165 RepID=A0A386ZCZ6_9NOCA|nr:MFS transporter [Nocardia yunnanensis]AYF74994.1 MFS transporter [Nocardia yunnanensis]